MGVGGSGRPRGVSAPPRCCASQGAEAQERADCSLFSETIYGGAVNPQVGREELWPVLTFSQLRYGGAPSHAARGPALLGSRQELRRTSRPNNQVRAKNSPPVNKCDGRLDVRAQVRAASALQAAPAWQGTKCDRTRSQRPRAGSLLGDGRLSRAAPTPGRGGAPRGTHAGCGCGPRGCRAGWWRCWRARGAPAPRAGPPRPRGGAWRSCVAGCGGAGP